MKDEPTYRHDARAIRLRRERMGMSRSRLASKSGIDIRTIQRIENEKARRKVIRHTTAVRLSYALDCPIEDLLMLDEQAAA
jgi:transcriptional regulator with XRE-family HTH domain